MNFYKKLFAGLLVEVFSVDALGLGVCGKSEEEIAAEKIAVI